MSQPIAQYACRDAGGVEGGGAGEGHVPLPPSFGISVNPIRTVQGGHITTAHPHRFGPCGVSVMCMFNVYTLHIFFMSLIIKEHICMYVIVFRV